AVLAGDAMNPEDYLLGRAHYLDSAGAHQAIMTPVSYDRTIKSSLKQQAAMYWNNSVDYRNGGDPRALASSLKASPKFRETLQQDLGVKEFKRLEDKLGTAIKNMGMNEGFLKLADDNRELAAKVKKLYDPANDYGLKQVANDLEKEVNKRNYLTSINIDGSYNPSIAQIEENVKNLQVLKRIAATMNDASYSSNPEKKAELQAEIRVGMSPYGTDKFEKKLTKVKQDVAKQTAGQDTKGPWWSFISPIGRTEFVGRRIQALVTGVPEDIEAEALENIRANKNMTNYLEATQTLNGRILAAIDSRDLTYKDGMALVGKVGMLSTVEKYDSLTTKKRNWYTQGFDSFNAYARNLDLRLGTLENNRRFRDDIRTQMVEDLSVRVASYGDVPLTEEKIAGLISQIKYEKNQQIHPEIMGVKPGEYITINGQSVEFVGFSNNTGAVQIKSKALKKAVDNL
ncbi:MAG: hypothetical protein KAU50_07155, partial [Candidatus Marinimicrobia bacterium]|nr:hypothetical protein [Candidatus Neomarinimicrobiota bacterium]